MAEEDLWLRSFLTEGVLFYAAVIIICLIVTARLYSNEIYIFIVNVFKLWVNKNGQLRKLKQDLFRSLQSGKTLVEIGVGSGGNFEFYPSSTSVVCIEPLQQFESHLSKAVKKFGEHLGSVDFRWDVAENLSVTVQPNSVDYIVCTFVLCSVKDLKQVLSEIKKVLKPGGSFYFLEHHAVPREKLDQAGFSHVEYNKHVLKGFLYFTPFRCMFVGSATK